MKPTGKPPVSYHPVRYGPVKAKYVAEAHLASKLIDDPLFFADHVQQEALSSCTLGLFFVPSEKVFGLGSECPNTFSGGTCSPRG